MSTATNKTNLSIADKELAGTKYAADKGQKQTITYRNK